MPDVDLDAHARELMSDNLYAVLGTVGADGIPWTSPVYFATSDFAEIYWVSQPGSRHSRNLAAHPAVSMVIFDSSVPAYHGRAVYLSGTATELAGREVVRGLEIYPGDPGRGGTSMAIEDVTAPAEWRLYRATIDEAFVLCPREPRRPCARHGVATDHRAPVEPWRHRS